MTAPAIRFYDYHPAPADFFGEVMAGLRRRPRAIPPKFFYDAEGSRLFEAICQTPEYYLTRTERAILERHAGEIAKLIGPGCLLIEPGCGSCDKVRLLLDVLKPRAYLPMDISGAYLREAAQGLAQAYPWLEVHAACMDFTAAMPLPYRPAGVRRIAFFPGSSIGNFDPEDAVAFLNSIAQTVGPGGGLLIGVDLKKDPAILNAAYNDAQGYTAAFNLNLLARINRELDADFDLDGFRHEACYDEDAGRVEMHLVSRRPQVVHVDGQRFEFDEGDDIHTENSYKYGREQFTALARRAGMVPAAVWSDHQRFFAVIFLSVVD